MIHHLQQLPRSCGARHRPLGHSSCKQSKNKYSKCWITRCRWKFQTQSQLRWGSEDKKTGGWSSMCAYKQVARAKLDLNKTRLFLVAAKEYMKVEGRPGGCWGRSPTLRRVPNGPNLIHGPLDQTKVTQHLWTDKLSVVIQSLRPPQNRYWLDSRSIWK